MNCTYSKNPKEKFRTLNPSCYTIVSMRTLSLLLFSYLEIVLVTVITRTDFDTPTHRASYPVGC